MKRIISQGAFICVAVLGMLFYAATQSRSQGSSAPFSVLYTDRSTTTTSNDVVERHMFYAVRTDSCRAIGSTDNPNQERVVFDTPGRKRTVITDSARLKSTYDYSALAGSVPLQRPHSANCSQESSHSTRTLAGEEVILGLPTFKYRTAMEPFSEDGSTEERTYWYAPSLDCFEVKLTAIRRDKPGTTTGEFVKEITSVQVGEPDASWFNIAGD